VALTDDERGRLYNDLKEVSGREPILAEAIDPDLLGGLVVRVGDWIYDTSLRTRLETMRNELIERSQP
jgi:F-type H+-transporting ATPase subunit delta